jgi:hypothetical protein
MTSTPRWKNRTSTNWDAHGDKAGAAGLSGCRALTTIGGMLRRVFRPNDGGVAKRYGVVVAGGGAGDGMDACVIFFFA